MIYHNNIYVHGGKQCLIRGARGTLYLVTSSVVLVVRTVIEHNNIVL
jgi:hypothetical protein